MAKVASMATSNPSNLTREQALEIVLERVSKMKGVEVDNDAIDAAVARMMGVAPPEKAPEPEAPKPVVSPFVANSLGLHEKYFPEGR